MSKSSTNTTISSTADPTGRTPQDYALEFAEYLAQGAEQFIAAVNADAEVRLRIAERDDVDDDTERDARSDVSEMMRELRRNIYEFRKRRDRAMRAQAAPAEPIVRLTGYQLRDALAFIAPDGTGDQLATEACIQRGPARTDGEDSDPAGMFCWYSDYPDEGSMRLGEGPEDCFATAPTTQPAPIDMVLHCPKCGLQHIDAPDWQNDPQLGAIRYANAQQRIDTSCDREAQQSHHEPVQVLLRDGGMASGGHAEQPVQEVQLPATAIHEANKGMHVVSAGNGRFTVLQGQQNGQPSSEVQGLPQERNRRLEEDQSGRGESGGTPPKQSAARDEAIRLDARGVSGAPESSGADLQHLREGRAPEAQEGPSIAGSLPCNGQDSGRAVLSLQHDAGLRERRLNVASQRDQVSCEAPLRAPIHRSHLCRPEDGGCRHIWRPADVPTNGVRAVKTKGEADSPLATPQPAARQEVDGEIALALSALEENHQWHQDYDDHDGYPGSSLEESNVRAISALKSIAAAHPQAKKGGT